MITILHKTTDIWDNLIHVFSSYKGHCHPLEIWVLCGVKVEYWRWLLICSHFHQLIWNQLSCFLFKNTHFSTKMTATSTIKMVTANSSKILVTTSNTAQHQNPIDHTLSQHLHLSVTNNHKFNGHQTQNSTWSHIILKATYISFLPNLCIKYYKVY
jgi:hypothetical protein